MSHELTTRTTGKTEMAFVGETPWHGLGQELTEGASIEEWTVAAGMDWKVQRSKVRYFTAPAAECAANPALQFEMPEQQVLFRSDSKAALGIVSPAYQIVQPKAVLEFFRDLTENAGMHLHTAGTLFGGRKFWALAKVADALVTGQDRIGGYLLLSTSCDGSMATEVRETTVRVVCNNTLTMARGVGAKRDVIKVGHRSRFNADAVKAQMMDSAEHFAAFAALARDLASKRVTNAMAEEFVRNLLAPIAEGEMRDPDARAPKGEADILNLFRSSAMGGTALGSAGTAWGLVNSVTEYVDHKQTAKTVDHRLDRAFFGSGDDLKNRAFDLAFSI